MSENTALGNLSEAQKLILAQLAYSTVSLTFRESYEWSRSCQMKDLSSYPKYNQIVIDLVDAQIISLRFSEALDDHVLSSENKELLEQAKQWLKNWHKKLFFIKGAQSAFADYWGTFYTKPEMYFSCLLMAAECDEDDLLRNLLKTIDRNGFRISDVNNFFQVFLNANKLHLLPPANFNSSYSLYILYSVYNFNNKLVEIPDRLGADKERAILIQNANSYVTAFGQGKFKNLIALKNLVPDCVGSLSLLHAAYQMLGDVKNTKSTFKLLKEVQALIISNKENVVDQGYGGILHTINIMKSGTPAAKNRLKKCSFFQTSMRGVFEDIVDYYNGGDEFETCIDDGLYPTSHIENVISLILMYWVENTCDAYEVEWCETLLNKVESEAYDYFALELAALLAKLTENKKYAQRADELKEQLGILPIVELEERKEKWQMKLEMLKDFGSKLSSSSGGKEERLVWLVDFDRKEIHPKVQKVTKNGSWTAGRNVSLANLSRGMVDCATKQDLKVTKYIQENYWGGRFYIEFDGAIQTLTGHPLLFLYNSPQVPIELEQKNVELIAEQNGDYFKVSFSHSLKEMDELAVEKMSANKYQIINYSDEIKQIADLIGSDVQVPLAAKDQLLDSLTPLVGTIPIRSALIGEETGAEKLEASHNIYAHMLPVGNGIKVELLTNPLEGGPFCIPGHGNQKLVGERDKKPVFCDRDMSQEKDNLTDLLQKCQLLDEFCDESYTAYFENPEDCLKILSELRDAAELVTVQWPKGEKIKLKTKLSLQNMNMSIKKENNWFDISGDIQISKDEVLGMKKLLRLMEKRKGNFIELEEGMFLELEKQFVKQLEFIDTFAEVTSKNIKVHPLAMLSASAMFDEIENLVADDEWNDFVKRIDASKNKRYQIPRNLDAELRPYQVEGYRWLRKLADWGVGACLADDMGLGKTIQCIALMLSRLSNGPALIVAPSSVCRNWVSEILKFGPSLHPVIFNESEREKTVQEAKAFDVVITSYGLMQSEAELFASRKWDTIVLDEAHAIKNTATKRSKAAMSLEGDFKIIATGTPLQNHMGELWNLFQFINPGLLGGQKSFVENIAGPIERNNDDGMRRRLKQIIQPFILRRLKNQVLDELPEKTEITLAVELSPEEQTFYHAMREKAIEDLAEVDSSNLGEKQMRVLAEITRLRLACCHPSLVMPNTQLSGAKLAQFENIVDNLKENNHKALVFSQFVKHLDILRSSLDRKGLTYEYLDGTTSMKEREKRIKNFQSGSADIFLISLKAGGVGLNLTAADYVIHMDPWWNPAIEDQASDRAHRIGQTRPVTIYRLVAKGTIEERIVDLHKNKRDLADSLLEGTEASAKITADDLISLLKSE